MSVKASCSITISIERIVESTYRYYKLQASTAAEPAKPDSIANLPQPPTGWQDREPTYSGDSTYSLYIVDLTVFSDGTFSYSNVSLSSSYEAAKEAYNKAQAASDAIPGINLSPFFSHDLADVYNSTTNPDGYWNYVGAGTGRSYEILSDGWVHVELDNSSGTSTITMNFMPVKNDAIEPGEDYTFLFEFRNRVSTAAGSGLCYLVQNDRCQFWGASVKKVLEGDGTQASLNIHDWVPTDGTIYRKRVLKTSEASDSSHAGAGFTRLAYIRCQASAGQVISYDFRVSIYKGEYMGPYVPYILSDATYIKKIADDAAAAANAIKVYEIKPSVSRVMIDWMTGNATPSSVSFSAYLNGESYTAGKILWEYKNSSNTWVTAKTTSGGTGTYVTDSSMTEIRGRLLSSDDVELASTMIPVLIDMSQVSQEDIFNKLTNNGAAGGLFYSNGQLYLNAAYLNVGDGVNIYSNYDTMSQITKDTLQWKNAGVQEYGVAESTRISGNMFYITTASTSSNGYLFLGNSENHKGAVATPVGGKYLISFYARTRTGSGKVKPWVITFSDWGTTQVNQNGGETYSIDATWKRFYFEYTSTAAYTGLGFANVQAGTTVYVCGIMIEPVDSFDQIPSPFAPAGTTQINGGLLKTGTVDANKIKVDDLYALKAKIGGWNINETSLSSAGMYSIDNVSQSKIELLKEGKLRIGGTTMDNHWGALRIQYGLELITKSNGETLSDGSGQFSIKNLTSVTGSTLGINSSDMVGRLSSSSKRYKVPCGDATHEEAEKLLDIPVVKFRYKDGYLAKGDQLEGVEMIGLYAEDVQQAIPEAAILDGEGRAEDWNHRILLPAMLKLIQDQEMRIAALEDRLNRLEGLNSTVDEQ